MAEGYRFIADLASEMKEIPTESIVSRTVYSDPAVKVVLFGFAAGQELSEHTASTPAVLHFLQGSARLTLGGEAQQAGVGTWVHMPANLQHSVRAETPVIMLLLLFREG